MVATLRRGPTIYQLTLKQAVRRKRRRVTLIAAFKCLEGVVICADSQETLSVITPDGPADYRCQVTKIRPEIAGQYYVVGGGAGDGDLIEAFTDRLLAEVQSWEGVLDAPTIKEKVRQMVFAFCRNEIALSNAPDTSIYYLLCIKSLVEGTEPVLLRVGKSTVISVDGYAMIGWEEAIYRHFADRLYKGPLCGQNRVLLLGVYLMMLGKSTSNVIGGPIRAVKITTHAMQEIDLETVAEVERRIESFARILEDVALWCPDASVQNHEFPAYLAHIETQLMELREQYFGPNDGTFVHRVNPPFNL